MAVVEMITIGVRLLPTMVENRDDIRVLLPDLRHHVSRYQLETLGVHLGLISQDAIEGICERTPCFYGEHRVVVCL